MIKDFPIILRFINQNNLIIMKKLRVLAHVLMILFVFAGFNSIAQQIKTPSPSPFSKVAQTVGLTDITISYSRPSVKDRVIFGDLVPFGKIWRTGANSATKVEFSDSVKIEGKALKAGAYALFTIPGKDEWTIIFNSNFNQGGTGDYKESEDVLRFTVKPEKLSEKVESFRIDVNNLKSTSANIELAWENTIVKFKVEVEVDSKVMSDIKRAMDPASDAGKYFSAASYYNETNRDLNQALEWINKSIQLAPGRYFVSYQKANILAKLGQYGEAIAAAQESKELAIKAGNNDYVALNDKAIAKWKTMK
jgi:tetratricopeptide (TPR) repeat protein